MPSTNTTPKLRDRQYTQFSKKLITAVMLLWGIIRIVSVVSVLINPEAGNNMAAVLRGVDDIAMVNVLAYTGNSVSEKIALGYFEYKSKQIDAEVETNISENG